MPDSLPPYEVRLTHAAEKELEHLPRKLQNQVGRTIDRLENRYSAGERPQDIRPIEGRPGSFGIDTGEFRILYEVDEANRVLLIWRIGNRKDVYRNL
ncbi:MAG: type II toxin-antitoxin system RelE/ParE family toxin [Chloroflexi bacterium]|nr:type II toxin-antitoxin system RelE/ParE family toxin [Chloroflexota bacterium]